jgi:O-antigen ligase
MFSLSRSAYITTIIILVALAIISRRTWLVFTLVIFLILGPFILPKAIVSRAVYNFSDARYLGFIDASLSERLSIWNKVFYYLKTYPVFGAGLTKEGVIDSQYARIIIETGLIGLILFLWLLLRLLGISFQLFRSAGVGWVKGLAAGFIIIIIGLAAHGWGNITFYIVRIAEPFWALAALIAFTLYYVSTQENNPSVLANSDSPK